MERGLPFVRRCKWWLWQRRSTDGEREILEKQEHILVIVITQNGKVVYYKNSILLCLFSVLRQLYFIIEPAGLWHSAV